MINPPKSTNSKNASLFDQIPGSEGGGVGVGVGGGVGVGVGGGVGDGYSIG